MEDRLFVVLTDRAKVDYARIKREAQFRLSTGHREGEEIQCFARTRKILAGLRDPVYSNSGRPMVDGVRILAMSEATTFVYYRLLPSFDDWPSFTVVYHICESNTNMFALLFELLTNEELLKLFGLQAPATYQASYFAVQATVN